MNYIGLSCGYHDAAISIVDNKGDILFAGHSERYSKIKNDKNLSPALIEDAKKYINDENLTFHYYENPYLKFLRQFYTGENPDLKNLNVNNIIGIENLKLFKNYEFTYTYNHHKSHAAAGFQTSPFKDAIVVVIDAIGEFNTITIWKASYDEHGYAKYKLLWKKNYPHSIGLFYSAFTHKVGLKPLEDEYILMGMANWGTPNHTNTIKDYLIKDLKDIKFKKNLHKGLPTDFLNNVDYMDIAASSQEILELLVNEVMLKAKKYKLSDNLVYMGGVALNCLANRNLGNYFKNIWIMPNPGDAGSSLGAASLGYRRKLNWKNAFLGFDINTQYPVDEIVNHLINYKIVGVANGRAEFGPRSLGNRSLLADPRGPNIKQKVNEIKQRQQFRPFAPVILEEFVHEYFDMPNNIPTSPYMQVVAKCRFPDKFPAIIHIDGTSRVQTVNKHDTSIIRKLLEYWYQKTKCPLLLNTSLNVKGQPIVNDLNDAIKFEKLYNIKVFY